LFFGHKKKSNVYSNDKENRQSLKPKGDVIGHSMNTQRPLVVVPEKRVILSNTLAADQSMNSYNPLNDFSHLNS